MSISAGGAALASLFQVFLDTQLQRSFMEGAPVYRTSGNKRVVDFFHSDRWRFERTYVALLFVLIDSWQHDEAAKRYAADEAPDNGIDGLLAAMEQDGQLHLMSQVRDYMFHRDLREYWDDGRVAVVMQMHAHEEIYRAFERMFDSVRRSIQGGRLSP